MHDLAQVLDRERMVEDLDARRSSIEKFGVGGNVPGDLRYQYIVIGQPHYLLKAASLTWT